MQQQQPLRTAIKLKEAIDKVPFYVTSLGTIPIEEWEKKYEDYDDDDSDGENWSERRDKLQDLVQLAKSCVITSKEGYFDKNFSRQIQLTIKVDNITYTNSMEAYSCDMLKDLYRHAIPAKYGDQQKLETVYNPDVRSSREITDFTVSNNLINKIEQLWKTYFYLNVIAKPYKINLYGPGDFFSEHKDTPDKGLIGTFLVGLGEYGTDYRYNGLVVDKIQWRSHINNWCAFFTDRPHKVYKLPEEAYRASIAFKIYVKDPSINIVDVRIIEPSMKIARKLAKLMNEEDQFGLILSHGYSVNENALKGIDMIFVKAVKLLPEVQYHIIPIMNAVKGYYPCEGDNSSIEYSSKVYPLTSDVIDYVLGERNNYTQLLSSKIHFYVLDEYPKYYCWKDQSQEAAEFTGNESRPGEEDSMYISRAIIVTKWYPDYEHKSKKMKILSSV